MQDQSMTLEWRDGRVPVSTRFDDPYFSLDDGLAETRHVFLSGNDLPARFADGFHVAELGFGTGLNLLATWDAWRRAGAPGRLHFTSFEAYPMGPADMALALQAFPEMQALAAALIDGLSGDGPVYDLGDVTLTVLVGDARTSLPAWGGRADAWFLDGFSPAKNPELWGADLMAEVGRHTAAAGTVATYTAAGHVRRGLEDAGFNVTRVPGFGRKRHMTRGVKA
ncbi:tRNA (5-methylaminomethyl-2-thiouridine)(34)-methyltransferase MnmD [Tateyamaria sp. SN6-1]|uniref:tRNA (5-methylaminomethyl-2-thiouridine)(34)-methyltransferase MnmD n=1 Tax=Tateyamaria sp. SN6-1 TaxID=3092148 RepID=UPI0039F544F3